MPADDWTRSAGRVVADLAASAGLVLDEWQCRVLQNGLRQRDNRRWCSFENVVICPRQNGKNAIIEARELAGLFLFGERLILHSAHEFKTAREAFLRIESLIGGSRDLSSKVKHVRHSHGEEEIELHTGARLRFVARSKSSGRGFSADTVILDEAFSLKPETMGALLPTLSAQPDPQIWYASSAPRADSAVLHALRARALSGDDVGQMMFAEWSIDVDEDDPSDPLSWARANPALGIRIDLGTIARERAAMPHDEFMIERLGVPQFPVDDLRTSGAFPVDAWARLADPAERWVGDPVGVVDVSPAGRASVVLAGRRADGSVHVALAENRAGTAWVAGVRDDLDARHYCVEWVRDPSGPAVELPGVWRDLRPRELVEACAALARAVDDGDVRWSCPEDLEPAVMGAVQSAVRVQRGDGSWQWSRRRSSQADISPLIAMAVGFVAARSEAAVSGLAVVL